MVRTTLQVTFTLTFRSNYLRMPRSLRCNGFEGPEHQIIYLSREIRSEVSEWLAGMITEARMLPIRKSSDFRLSVAMRPCVEPEKRIPERSTNNHPPYFRLPTTWRASYYA